MAASRWDSVPATNPKSVHLPPAKTNVAIAKNTSPFAATMPFPGAQGRLGAADALGGW
jgi:hypothetical protein